MKIVDNSGPLEQEIQDLAPGTVFKWAKCYYILTDNKDVHNVYVTVKLADGAYCSHEADTIVTVLHAELVLT